jgi:hypothetical protein
LSSAPGYASQRLLREPIAALGDDEDEASCRRRPHSAYQRPRFVSAFAPMRRSAWREDRGFASERLLDSLPTENVTERARKDVR